MTHPDPNHTAATALGELPRKRYTICVDFDGVVHSYTSPFDPDCIPDPPVPGAFEWLEGIAKDFDVVLFTTRAERPGFARLIREWFLSHGMNPWPIFRDITSVKPPALVYIDDRAYRFTGDNFPSAQQIHQLRPWKNRV